MDRWIKVVVMVLSLPAVRLKSLTYNILRESASICLLDLCWDLSRFSKLSFIYQFQDYIYIYSLTYNPRTYYRHLSERFILSLQSLQCSVGAGYYDLEWTTKVSGINCEQFGIFCISTFLASTVSACYSCKLGSLLQQSGSGILFCSSATNCKYN